MTLTISTKLALAWALDGVSFDVLGGFIDKLTIRLTQTCLPDNIR